jgi:hypothetical protein
METALDRGNRPKGVRMKVMFTAYLIFIASTISYFVVIGLSHH